MRVWTLMLLLSLSLFASQNSNKTLKFVCLLSEEEVPEAICSLPQSSQIVINEELSLTNNISFVQEKIREEIGENYKVVLVAKGFLGTLVSIAQTNMLPYYRNNIRGMILENTPANLFQSCVIKKAKVENENCHSINSLHNTMGDIASKAEIFTSISPLLQMDWYWPKVILIGDNYQNEWVQAFSDNSVEYKKVSSLDINSTLKYFELIKSKKVQPQNKVIEPNYFGPQLRFHLNKVLYKAKNNIVIKQNIAYGKAGLQTYDVYYNESNESKPILFYVHGGGWTKGDKHSYDGFSMQFADRGFTVINLNYRLMRYPEVGMKEIVRDVVSGMEHALDNATNYQGDSKKVIVMAESAGGQLAAVAISQLSPKYKVSASFFNSMSTDLHIFPKKKQIRLSSIVEDTNRTQWLDDFSPINQLHQYAVPTLVAHSFDDKVVPSKHLEDYELLSILHHQNIKSLWVEGGVHPIVPLKRSLQPSYIDIENEFFKFLDKYLTNIK